jgi:hypothetical protein
MFGDLRKCFSEIASLGDELIKVAAVFVHSFSIWCKNPPDNGRGKAKSFAITLFFVLLTRETGTIGFVWGV